MKTYKKWEKADDAWLHWYLWNQPCEIDEELYNYIGWVTAPQYCFLGLIQGGDAVRSEDWVLFFDTITYIDNKYFYLWILPEFQQ